MLTIDVGTHLRSTRRALGLSQSALATAADVSLATVQNVEAGRANPSLSTLSRLLAPLGTGLSFTPTAADWRALITLGLPLAGEGDPLVRLDAETLRRHVGRAAIEVTRDTQPTDTQPTDTKSANTESANTESADTESANTESADTGAIGAEPADTERRRECVQALLCATETHFPSVVGRWGATSPAIRDLLAAPRTGRIVKLARIARSRLAEYL